MEDLAAKLINYISSMGPYAQVGLGAVSGWISGFSVMKIGKFAIAVIGGAMIVITIAEIKEVLHIDWMKVKQNVHNITVTNLNFTNTEDLQSDIQSFLISFLGGSFIGIGCA